jgi:hypothetical protein
MVDPNRKINLHHTEDSDDDDDDIVADLKDEHVQMVKEFEEAFKDRFTDQDAEYMKYIERKTKPLIIVYPFDDHRGGRGGYQGGGSYRYHNNRGGRNHYHSYNRNNYQDNQRRNFNQHNRYQNHQQRPFDRENRFRRDE